MLLHWPGRDQGHGECEALAVQVNQDGEVEIIDGVEIVHHFAEVPGPHGEILWHYVETGPADADTEVIVFFHGNGESWWSWHPQLVRLSRRFKMVAIDLKGYGQSDKRDGNYHWRMYPKRRWP